MTRYALNGPKYDAARNKANEQPETVKCIVVGARAISGKKTGEEVELPADQAGRLISLGLVEKKPEPKPATKSAVDTESAALHGPSVPKSRKG